MEISDLPDPAAALAAVASAGFVVSLEIRASAVTELADVVFPVAAAAEKSGAYVNWEGRTAAVRRRRCRRPGMLDEARILDTLGVEMDVDLYTQTPGRGAGRDGPARRLDRPPTRASATRPARVGTRPAVRTAETAGGVGVRAGRPGG